MLKLTPILVLAVLLYACPKNKPQPDSKPSPSPTPISSPTVEPSPTPEPSVTPSPRPTPNIRIEDYLPAPLTEGVLVTVVGPDDLSTKLQAAQDDPTVNIVSVTGGGSFTKPVILKKHTLFDSSTYSCDITDIAGNVPGVSVTDYGCFRLADGVMVKGTWRPPQALFEYWLKGNGRNPRDPYLLKVQALTAEELAGTGTTFLEPTYTNGGQPSIIVFQTLGDACCSHASKAENVAIIGIHIKGRQKTPDGGVRSTVQFGNCHQCLAQHIYLEDTGSIGISFGGTSNEGNFANNVVAYQNVTSGVAAANIAAVNADNVFSFENYAFRPGHHDPLFGGGVCGFDLETNNPSGTDHSGNVWVFNNLYDYEGANRDGAGSAICLQDPYAGVNRGKVAAVNNVVIGGRDDRLFRYMTNGLFLNNLKDCEIANNYVYRTGQNGIQAYGISGCVIEDNDFESTGSSTNPTIATEGAINNIFRRNNYRDRPRLEISTHAGIGEVCGSGNVYEDNRVRGVEVQPSKVCPPASQRNIKPRRP